MSKLIDSVALPQGLRDLNYSQLQQVADELRDELIDSIAESGGHFASSLGATELSVALHYAFNTPDDRLVWDVGHQGYIHKMLTGRRSQLGSIRQKDGISGFLKRSESPYDAFGAGHAGTSVSAAVGMATAFRDSHPERSVVAVIGDGAMTCGMAFEALNHAGDLGLGNLIVLLNDNEMSIAPNVGAMSRYFSLTVTSEISTRARAKFKRAYKKGYIPEFIYKTIDRAEETTQSWFSGAATLFEAFGFRYIGPVDGHNVEAVVKALENAKAQDVPVVVHASTLKGKGFDPAEEDPWKWHATKPFDRNGVGKKVAKSKAAPTIPSYTKVFSDTLITIAEQNSTVRAITAAMPDGTGLDAFQKVHPDKYFDVGIAEQHAVTFAAGLACEGLKPVCAIYSTFLQRAFDQVVHDVCIQELPVVFAMDRGGVVGNDGETHQGVFDIAYLRALPHMTIMAPKDENELQHMLYTAVEHDGPIAFRYPRGAGTGVALDKEFQKLPIGKAEVLRQGSEVLLIGFGNTVGSALTIADNLSEILGITTTVVNARFAKPLDEELLSELIPKHALVCTLEEHALMGGFGSAVLEFVHNNEIRTQSAIKRFGVGDQFLAHASQDEQRVAQRIDSGWITEFLLEYLGEKKAAGL